MTQLRSLIPDVGHCFWRQMRLNLTM
jgi:hypothetical protein